MAEDRRSTLSDKLAEKWNSLLQAVRSCDNRKSAAQAVIPGSAQTQTKKKIEMKNILERPIVFRITERQLLLCRLLLSLVEWHRAHKQHVFGLAKLRSDLDSSLNATAGVA